MWPVFFGLGLGAYPFFLVLRLAVSLLQRLTFPNAEVPAQRKVSKRLCPRRTALRLGSVFPRYGVHPGASPTVCFAAPPLDVCGYAARRCAPTPDEHLHSACRWGPKSKARSRATAKARSRAPHPSPLPEGEGTDRGVWAKYADLGYRVEHTF